MKEIAEKYVQDIQEMKLNASADPTIVEESTSTAMVDGNDGLGPVVAKFCMDLAIEKAMGAGISMVAAKVKQNLRGNKNKWNYQCFSYRFE